MIKVAGTATRSFLFPADLAAAYSYYADIDHVLNHLPYITLAQVYGDNQFQVVYNKTELGSYRIRIISHVQFVLDRGGWIIEVNPLKNRTIQARSTLNSTSGPGHFASRSVFQAEGDQTRIDYSLKLQSHLPKPLGMRLLPGAAVNGLADKITHSRIDEIAEGFIARTIDAFPRWLAAREARSA